MKREYCLKFYECELFFPCLWTFKKKKKGGGGNKQANTRTGVRCTFGNHHRCLVQDRVLLFFETNQKFKRLQRCVRLDQKPLYMEPDALFVQCEKVTKSTKVISSVWYPVLQLYTVDMFFTRFFLCNFTCQPLVFISWSSAGSGTEYNHCLEVLPADW